jgi:16S rRNA (cytosine967-C5)-methyltransferase
MISPARWAAFEALRLADPAKGSGKDLASALAGTRSQVHDLRDRALATELALGVERWRAAIDATIAAVSGRAIGSIDFPALLSLRLAVFQLRYLTRTPAHAVVDDAVEIVRRAGAFRAAGFVNGVLRSLLRAGAGIDDGLPSRPEAIEPEVSRAWIEYLTTTLSHPEWLVTRWVRRHGVAAAEAWATFNNSAAPLTVRVNTRRIAADAARAALEAEGIIVEPARYAPDALVAVSGNPMLSTLHDDGRIALMDEASQLVGVLAASVLSGDVLDACAAPGGKTLVLACGLPADSRLMAADRRPRRVTVLRRALARYGLADIGIVQHDLARGVPFKTLGGVLVDAPCSGLGTIRRDPDVRWRRSESDLGPLAAAERGMLHQAALALAPGGRLVYATCSSEPEENEHVVDAFLSEHREFARVVIAEPALAPFVTDREEFQTLPHRDGLESFFAAVLTRL